jgi:hypothetical protein
MTTQIRRSDSDVSSGQIDMTSASKPGRRRIVLLLTALGALVLTVPIVVIALVNWTGDPASTVIPSGPAAIPPAPASPSSSVSSGPTVTHPTQHLPAVPRVPERYRAVPL